MLQRPLSVLATSLLLAPLAVLAFACDETPRGEQGIDYYGEGGSDAGPTPDATGPCKEEPDPSGICAQLGGQGTLYTHLIVCNAGQKPAFIDCNQVGATSTNGSGTFCCTTGLP